MANRLNVVNVCRINALFGDKNGVVWRLFSVIWKQADRIFRNVREVFLELHKWKLCVSFWVVGRSGKGETEEYM